MSRNNIKDKIERDNRRVHSIMNQDDIASGKRSNWSELEISGTIRNLSPHLWRLSHLTVLYLNNNCLSRIPADIGKLHNLQHLDLSNNKLRSLPSELGDLICLRELQLNNNVLRVLPYEIGKLFQLQILGLKGNPLTKEILNLYGDGMGTSKLLAYMLDNLTGGRPPGATASTTANEAKGNEKQNGRSPSNYDGPRSEGGWAGGVPLISVARGNNYCPRLALRGAPLILTPRGKGPAGGRQPPPEAPGRRRPSGKEAQAAHRGSDTVSVASDEGSSSVNSESSLPRIIKPRKRRKKERRPAKAREDAAAEAVQPAPPAVEEVPPNTRPEVVETAKVEEDVPASLCHCRLCDPTGFIWGMDGSCYSPFPPRPLFSSYGSISAPFDCEPPDIVSNRVYSTSSSDSATGNASTESDGDDHGRWSGRNLEVSSEIVTSPNGHRDLEIKFFSTFSKTSKGKKESDTPLRSWNSYELRAVEV